MKKLVVLLAISIVIMTVVSGVFFYQLNTVQDENSNLKSEIFEVSNRLKVEQNHSSQLERQVNQLKNQKEQLEEEIVGLENRIHEFENPVYDVKIISLSVKENINTPVGVALFFDAYITIRNKGNNSVTGLVIFLKRIGDTNYLLGSGYRLLDTIQPGEEREIHAEIETNLGLAWKIKPIIHIATLRLGTLIIDEYTLT